MSQQYRLSLLLFIGMSGLGIYLLSYQLPISLWWSTLTSPQLHDVNQVVVYFSWLPRLIVTLIAGAGLGLAGALTQLLLRNPLASPTTLGIASGAQLALMMVTLFAPSLLLIGREWIAISGGLLAVGLVLLLSWKRNLDPLVTVFSGLVINLYFASISACLLIFFQEELKGLLIWGSGSLAQNGWAGVRFLLPRFVLCVIATLLLNRPLAILALDDATVRSLGISLKKLRIMGLSIAVFITACIVSVVGLIGFIGLAAPTIVRLSGTRHFSSRLFYSTIVGALLLTTTDLLLQLLGQSTALLIPTGAVTALLGAPLLLWLIPRIRFNACPTKSTTDSIRHPHPQQQVKRLLFAVLLIVLMSFCIGYQFNGNDFHFSLLSNITDINRFALTWQTPRVFAAVAAGILLALAGTLLQRISQNPMASPELLGISGSTLMGVLLFALLLPNLPIALMWLGGALGALGCLLLLITLNRRNNFQPERVLLTGIAITAMFEPLQSIALANGNLKMQQLLSWMSGSTYYVSLSLSLYLLLFALLMLILTQLLTRWLDLLPMGPAISTAVGININKAQLVSLLLVALLTASATLVVGPLSFVGLLAPHMARMAGLTQARWHLFGAALSGALVMVSADWLGQQIVFPQEVPTGLVSTFLGGSYFLWQLRNQSK